MAVMSNTHPLSLWCHLWQCPWEIGSSTWAEMVGQG